MADLAPREGRRGAREGQEGDEAEQASVHDPLATKIEVEDLGPSYTELTTIRRGAGGATAT